MRQSRMPEPQPAALKDEGPSVPQHGGRAAELLDLQRRAGNRAVCRLLARQAQTAPQLPPMPLVNDPLTGTTQGDLGPRAQHTQLAWGANGPEVEFLQGRLNQDGANPPLDVDGKFRDLTRTAVREFQMRHGLLVDGIVGPQTWGMIDELARAGIAGPHDVMSPTAPVTQAEATAITTHLGTATPTGQAIVTGYRAEMLQALDDFYDRELGSLLAQPITDMRHAERLRDIAQRLVDDFYSDHIVMASREGNLRSLHAGSFVFPVGDATTRPVADEFIKAWVMLDMLPEQPRPDADPAPSDVSFRHNINTNRPADQRLVDGIADAYLQQAGRRAKVRRYIRSYPAEVSSGTAFLGLRSRSWLADDVTGTPTRRDLRRAMWDLLSGLMHEYLHQLAHHHFSETAEQLGGTPRRVLIEGFCDYFRKQVWDALMPRFLSDAALRAEVEGQYGHTANGTQPLPLDADVIVPHSYYDELENATAIVQDLGGGDRAEANARAAYFMGHVDLLGIGDTTRGEHAAGRLGTWRPTDAEEDDLYVVLAGGELVRDVWDRTGSTAVQNEADGFFFGPAAAGTRLPAGTRLRVRGIRHVRATQSDTRAQVASQNGVTQRALERANHWAPAAGNTRVPLGVRILIPAH
jgi:peptidoglycan hydrolase-like protein with peptidoglycan-binding domain